MQSEKVKRIALINCQVPLINMSKNNCFELIQCSTLYWYRYDHITFNHFLPNTDIMYYDTVKHYHDFIDNALHLNKPSLLLRYTLLLRCALNNSLKGRNIQRQTLFWSEP